MFRGEAGLQLTLYATNVCTCLPRHHRESMSVWLIKFACCFAVLHILAASALSCLRRDSLGHKVFRQEDHALLNVSCSSAAEQGFFWRMQTAIQLRGSGFGIVGTWAFTPNGRMLTCMLTCLSASRPKADSDCSCPFADKAP